MAVPSDTKEDGLLSVYYSVYTASLSRLCQKALGRFVVFLFAFCYKPVFLRNCGTVRTSV